MSLTYPWIIMLLSLVGLVTVDSTTVERSEAYSVSTQPNILFIVTDDMDPTMFNNLPEGRGKNLTPNLDRLISEGSFLSNMHVASPVCTPSRYNLLTGNYASRATNTRFTDFTDDNEGQTVIQWNTNIVPGDRSTMGGHLQNLGYRTGFVGKNHVVESPSQQQQGRADHLNADPEDLEIKVLLERRHAALQADIQSVGFDYANSLYHDNPNWLGIRALAVQNMDWITASALEFLQHESEQPFFLYFATTLPHSPTSPQRSWRADPRLIALGLLEEPLNVQSARDTLEPRIAAASLAPSNGPRRENVLWVDDAISALLETLETTDQLDNTIIVFFNDHCQDEQGTLYNGGIKTQAFIWRSNGFGCGSDCGFQASNTNFLDTVFELAGGDPAILSNDGESFAQALETGQRAAKPSMYFELGYARAVIKGDYKYLALRYPASAEALDLDGRRALLEDYNDMRVSFGMTAISDDPTLPFGHLEMVPGGGGAENKVYMTRPGLFAHDQLYNIAIDPRETVNLVDDPDHAEILEEMQQELRRYVDRLPGDFAITD